ncbi:hypothetical protein ACVWXO_005424 [Bradyrhizobium sp. LM2.7]
MAWIEAFDGIALVEIIKAMRSLEAFEERDLAGSLQTSTTSKLRRPLNPAPKQNRAYKKRKRGN